jgi:hypothetical protein
MTIGPAAAGMLVALSSWAGAQSASVEQLAWLQGCWEAVSPGQTIEEQWMPPRGHAMLGVSRTVRDDRLAAYELVVVREDGGRLAYEAHPSGQAAATFASRSLGESSVVFENPDHDFPQRVGYTRTGPDALLAWIEGTRNGQVRRVEFRYHRVACAGAPPR